MSSTTRTTGKEIAAALGVFGLSFVVVTFLIHLGIRNPLYLHADLRSEKLTILNEWSGKAYSASFGSSHMHNGFDPRVFDQVMTGTPAQTRTINLAVAGGSQSEQRMMALEFLHHMQAPADHPPQTCLVILELAAGANFTNDHLIHPRAINIYDWTTTKFIMQLAPHEMALRQRIGRIGYAWAAMGLHYMNIGMLSSSIFPAPEDSEMMHDETVEDRRGLLLVPRPASVLQAIQEIIAEAPKQPKVVQAVILPGNRVLVDQLQEASPVHNLQVAYEVMPKIGDLTEWNSYPDEIETTHGMVPVINLANPTRYSQIYQPKFWMDDSHLNEAGAQVATRLFAEELQRWYATHGGPARCER